MSNDATQPIDIQLADARAATTFVSGLLQEMNDTDFDGDSLLPGWTRRHVVAHLAQNGLAVGRLVSWAATGVETPMYESREVRDREIDVTAQLAPDVLRALFHDTAAALDAAWLALPASGWSVAVRAGQGRIVPASATFWMRIRELWVHGVDLNVGAGFEAVPEPKLRHILDDVVASWQTPVFRLDVDAPHSMSLGDDGAASVVSGSLADLTGWATGRTKVGISSAEFPVPAAPHWI